MHTRRRHRATCIAPPSASVLIQGCATVFACSDRILPVPSETPLGRYSNILITNPRLYIIRKFCAVYRFSLDRGGGLQPKMAPPSCENTGFIPHAVVHRCRVLSPFLLQRSVLKQYIKRLAWYTNDSYACPPVTIPWWRQSSWRTHRAMCCRSAAWRSQLHARCVHRYTINCNPCALIASYMYIATLWTAVYSLLRPLAVSPWHERAARGERQ